MNTPDARTGSRLAMAALMTSLALCASGPASADVLEIGASGAVKIRRGATAVVWSDPVGQESFTQASPELPPEVLTLVEGRSPPAPYAAALAAAAHRHGLSPSLLEALVWQESRWRADALSPKGARGLTQLMPGTARDLGVDARDPLANLEGGARYLRLQLDRFGGDVERALAAYNAGPQRVLRAGGVPNIPETRAYVAAILGRLQAQTR